MLHDPEYRRVRKEHLIEAGKRIRLKQNIRLLSRVLDALSGYRFSFYVILAAPEEVIQLALEGIVAKDHTYGTRFHYDPSSGEIQAIMGVGLRHPHSRAAGDCGQCDCRHACGGFFRQAVSEMENSAPALSAQRAASVRRV